MDTSTGRIYREPEEVRRLRERLARAGAGAETIERRVRPMLVDPTPQQLARKPPKIGRNEPCPCGSGKKFKRCCLFVEPRP